MLNDMSDTIRSEYERRLADRRLAEEIRLAE